VLFRAFQQEGGGTVRLDSKPVYRKVILPWYDSDPLCAWIIVLMVAVFLFACAGISVAGSHPFWSSHIWVPILLAGLSLGVLFSTSVRLVKRTLDKRSNESRL
jgi:amino acid permease